MPSERVQRRIDRLLDDAEVAADQHDWEKVLELVAGVLKADPVNEDAQTFQDMAEASLSPGVQSSSSPSTSFPPTQSQPPKSQPASFASGRYTVSRFLGEGGKKKVYLAHDNTLDRDVAFALIKTEGLDDTARERVKREAQAMGRMGTHPCIMPIYDLGEETDANGVAQPFMVQPLMGGGDVEGLIEDADGPLPLEDAIRIATQTAQGLVFAHGKGIVHRDLKPGNVWMDEDGAAKIGDFGLAIATDRSRLTVEKMMVGTVNYMPPEQATGGEVTPKADLYSLGAMLYEMATGRAPFMGDDDIAVISQHVNTPPVAPSWHNALIPKTLDSLILRMMAKDPAERPVDADEVLVALNAVDLSSVEERDDSGKGSLDAMAGGVFVGRHKEMDQLKAGFEEVLSGKGRMVTLVGEPGIGKTRTAHELATYAAMRGAEVLWGRSYESGGAPPYWPWVQAIRSHVAATKSETLRTQMGSTAPVIAEIVSDIREKLPDTPAATPIEDPESARFRLFDSISTFLKNTASGTPLVLMLEDLHWSDKPSLMLLEFVARELANSRILIVGNYRDMELNRRHPLSVTLGDLSRERLFERVVLRGLQRHDVERFIEIAAGITPPPALVDTVHSQTEGNPLFVTETVRLLIQEGDITSGQSTSGGTTSWEIRIPEGVREVIGRRLDRLSERTNEVLTIAAVIGRQFRFPVLKMLMEDTTDGQLLDALDEALSARIIEELPTEVGLYQFTHAQMQETLTEELSANRRVRMHARIAEALEEHYGDTAEEHASELVEHFAEAETVLGTEKLVKYSLAAGNRSLRNFASLDARIHFERGIGALGSGQRDEIAAAIYHGLGQAQAATLERPQAQIAVDNLTTGYDIYEDIGHIERALEVASYPFQNVHGPVGLLALAERALPHADEGSRIQGGLLVQQANWLSTERGDYESSVELLRRAQKIADAHQDSVLDMRVNLVASSVHQWAEEVDASLTAAERSLELAKEVNAFDIEVNARFQMAANSMWKGDMESAFEHARLSIEPARRCGNVFQFTSAMSANSFIRSMTGDYAGASKFLEEGLQASPNETRLLGNLASNQLVTGEIDKARSFIYPFIKRQLSISNPNIVSLLTVVNMVGTELIETGRSEYAETAMKIARDLASREHVEKRVIKGGLVYQMISAVVFNNKELAGKLIDSASSSRQNISIQVRSSWLFGALLLTAGRIDDAVKDLEDLVLSTRVSGLKPMLANANLYLAEALTARNASGDHDKAVELQDEAIAIATELSMKPLLERVLAKREILKA